VNLKLIISAQIVHSFSETGRGGGEEEKERRKRKKEKEKKLVWW
jgi:hypothetical protein